MTSGASSAGHPLDRRPEHYVGAEGEQPAEAEPTPGKVGWINVYQRANGEQLVGGSCWASREQADQMAGSATAKIAFRLKVTAKPVA